jgi:hypothetical protein
MPERAIVGQNVCLCVRARAHASACERILEGRVTGHRSWQRLLGPIAMRRRLHGRPLRVAIGLRLVLFDTKSPLVRTQVAAVLRFLGPRPCRRQGPGGAQALVSG